MGRDRIGQLPRIQRSALRPAPHKLLFGSLHIGAVGRLRGGWNGSAVKGSKVKTSKRGCGRALSSGRGAALAAEEQTARYGRLAFLHRSEEHTAELQSLLRISYAVFCSKTNKITDLHN